MAADLRATTSTGATAALGAAAGVLATLGFMVLHQLTISDIWFSIVPMVLAGAMCGASLAWNHALLFEPGTRGWFGYISVHVALQLGLGVVSVLWFDPVIPVAVVMNLDGPPEDLIAQAGPLTAVWIVAATVLLSAWRGYRPVQVVSSLLTCTLLFLLLGINVSVLGLVEWSSEGMGVLAEFLSLIAVILYSYAACVELLQRGRRRVAPVSSGRA